MLFKLALDLWRRLPIPFGLRWLIIWVGTTKFLVGILAVIFNQSGEILLFNHTYRRKFSWGLPSGWLKKGEDPAAAIEREVFEETGFRIRALHPLVIGYSKTHTRLDLIFLCTYDGDPFVPSDEISEARFFSIDALPDGLLPTQYEIVSGAHQLVKEQYPEGLKNNFRARFTFEN